MGRLVLKSAAYSREGVPVRFRSQAPIPMRLFKSCKFEKAFFIVFRVAHSLHKKSLQHTDVYVTRFLIALNKTKQLAKLKINSDYERSSSK